MALFNLQSSYSSGTDTCAVLPQATKCRSVRVCSCHLRHWMTWGSPAIGLPGHGWACRSMAARLMNDATYAKHGHEIISRLLRSCLSHARWKGFILQVGRNWPPVCSALLCNFIFLKSSLPIFPSSLKLNYCLLSGVKCSLMFCASVCLKACFLLCLWNYPLGYKGPVRSGHRWCELSFHCPFQ